MHGGRGGTRVCSEHVKSGTPTRHPRGDVKFAAETSSRQQGTAEDVNCSIQMVKVSELVRSHREKIQRKKKRALQMKI